MHVVYCHVQNHLGANDRIDTFLLKGLAQLEQDCLEHNIPFTLLYGDPAEQLTPWLNAMRPAIVITDFEPLHNSQRWIDSVVASSDFPVHQVDAHNIVPCWHVSQKQEFAAYTIRPKINRLLPDFLEEFPEMVRHPFGA
ncbi:MAG: deoxyribodipyrimidine photo-lyase, partial [Candidatus Kapabacteria bacterium]|nr:deoxyribodipyrimidine photo-lyase [Candidatus Kapabacteria bacterium]